MTTLSKEAAPLTLFQNSELWWGATAFYFCYVVLGMFYKYCIQCDHTLAELGGLDHKLHEHVYTGDGTEEGNAWRSGDMMEFIKAILKRITTGQLATFGKDVYSTFFFPAFLAYHNTYKIHVRLTFQQPIDLF